MVSEFSGQCISLEVPINDVNDRDPPRDPEPPLTLAQYLQELDVSGLPRRLKLISVAVAVLLLLTGLNWARTFYTDWLWFSNLGYQQILLKIVTTKVWLFLAVCLWPKADIRTESKSTFLNVRY